MSCGVEPRELRILQPWESVCLDIPRSHKSHCKWLFIGSIRGFKHTQTLVPVSGRRPPLAIHQVSKKALEKIQRVRDHTHTHTRTHAHTHAHTHTHTHRHTKAHTHTHIHQVFIVHTGASVHKQGSYFHEVVPPVV